MSALSRRTLLKGAAVAGAAGALPLGAQALGSDRLVIYDSRLPASLAFARTTGSALTVDLAEAHLTRFAALRQDLPRAARIEGLTRRSDFVPLMRELGRQGFRVVSERKASGLVRWSMRQR